MHLSLPVKIYKSATALSNILTKTSPRYVNESFRIVEVGARDGLQNESFIVDTKDKIEFINHLSECGFQTIEATSFVSPKWVPQMADHVDVFNGIKRYLNVSYPVLVPNLTGLNNALVHNVTEIAVFTAASDSFSHKNKNCSLEDSLKITKDVIEEGIRHGLRIRGYISTVIGCPYEGKISPTVVARIASKLFEYGCYEVSLGDTIGVGSVGTVQALLDELLPVVSFKNLAVHFHDTYGQALSNVLISIEKGIRVADSSIAGLGGCPFAKGASGNLATEDLIYLLHDLDFNTGVNFDRLVKTSDWICKKMGRINASKAASATLSKK